MSFHIGMKVVCVDATTPSGHGRVPHELTEGAIYTISGIFDGFAGLGLELAEVAAPYAALHLPSYTASRFRPVVEDRKRISFTIGADPDSERFDNRKKNKEKV